MQLPQGVIDNYESGYDVFLPANSVFNETPFKDPKNTSALVKDNGLPYEQFREVINFQHPGGTLEARMLIFAPIESPSNFNFSMKASSSSIRLTSAQKNGFSSTYAKSMQSNVRFPICER